MSKYAAKAAAAQAVRVVPPLPRTPKAQAVAARRQREAWRAADLAHCQERFPALFNPVNPRPLAIGIDGPLGKILGTKRARRLLAWWAVWPPYLEAVAGGGARYNLEGSEAGQVSERNQAQARASVDMLAQAKAASDAAASAQRKAA